MIPLTRNVQNMHIYRQKQRIREAGEVLRIGEGLSVGEGLLGIVMKMLIKSIVAKISNSINTPKTH